MRVANTSASAVTTGRLRHSPSERKSYIDDSRGAALAPPKGSKVKRPKKPRVITQSHVRWPTRLLLVVQPTVWLPGCPVQLLVWCGYRPLSTQWSCTRSEILSYRALLSLFGDHCTWDVWPPIASLDPTPTDSAKDAIQSTSGHASNKADRIG